MLWQINRSGSDDGEFNLPHGIAEDAQGKLYVADRKAELHNHRLQKFILNP